MKAVKNKLRDLIGVVLRRLPVARGVYAERDELRKRVLFAAEDDVANFIKEADTARKNRLFDAFGAAGLSDFLYVEADRMRFLVDAKDQGISRSLFISGRSDFNKFELAARLLKERSGDTFIADLLVDAGANLGSICIPAVLLGFAKSAIAIEPQPTNCRLLRANIAVNGLHDRIQVIERAASDRDDAVLSLELAASNSGDNRIARSREPGRYGEAERAHIDVSSIKLDSLAGIAAEARSLLWMDIQGHEGHALRGAERLLAKTPPLVLEFWPYGMLRADSFSALCDSIAHYRGFHDLEKPTRGLRPISELAALFDELGSDGKFTDILVT